MRYDGSNGQIWHQKAPFFFRFFDRSNGGIRGPLRHPDCVAPLGSGKSDPVYACDDHYGGVRTCDHTQTSFSAKGGYAATNEAQCGILAQRARHSGSRGVVTYDPEDLIRRRQ